MAIDVLPEILVGGRPVPVTSFTVHSSTYGSIGHLDFTSSIEALQLVGVDLINLSIQSPASLEVHAYVTLNNVRTHIFGGEYVLSKWSYDRSIVAIHCRDFAGLLIDQKRILGKIAETTTSALAPGQVSGAGIETQNQKLSQVVTSIAKQFGFTPELHLQGGDPEIGTIFGSDDSIYWPTPQSLYAILMKLARDTGYECYVTPDKKLVFGTPGAGLQTITLTYGTSGQQLDGSTYPTYDLHVEHNPRRNLSFRVLVLSYDPAKATFTKGTKIVLGTNVSLPGGSTLRSGAWSGASEADITSKLDETGQDKKFPIYTIRVDGLTQEQAQKKAEAIAADIAKREIIITASTDGIPSILPLNPIAITSPVVDPQFTAHQFWASSYSHVFRMASGRHHGADFHTVITALDLQLSGSGDPVTTGQANPA